MKKFDPAAAFKKSLDDSIHQLALNKEKYCRSPGKNFSRVKKLSFEDSIRLILEFQDDRLQKEINRYFGFSSLKSPTKSAFIQRREQIKPAAFSDLFKMFLQSVSLNRTFMGYRLLACDGSDINLNRNPNNKKTSVQTQPELKSFNMIHLNALYDLLNKVYTDYTINYGLHSFEGKALYQMAAKIPKKVPTIIVADRAYGNYNSILHLQKLGKHFVIRTKDINSNGILASFHFPDSEFDRIISTNLVCANQKIYRDDPNCTVINRNSLDFFESKFDEVPVSFRVVRFKISSSSYESLITDLPESEFPVSVLKKIYNMRWGIELSFRDLKYVVGLMHFHSKQLNSVLQELHASLLLMNIASLIAQSVPFKQPTNAKYIYTINFAEAVGACRIFLSKTGKKSSLKLILKNPTPIRPGRLYPRHIHDSIPAASFNYRPS